MIREDDKSLNLTPSLFVLLKKSVEKQKWLEVLLLMTNPDLDIPGEYWPNLAKFKNQIINSENLQSDFVNEEYLRWSLKSSTHLGKLAEHKSQWLSGLFKGPSKAEATVLIEQELASRNKSVKNGRSIANNRELIHQMAFLVEIDQASRDIVAQRDALRFREELNQWMSENKDDINHPLFSLMEILVMLMDKGYPALPNKKNKYDDGLVFTKVSLNSPKIEKKQENGFYAGKHTAHINDYVSLLLTTVAKYKLMSVIFHELIHHLCQVVFNSYIPNPVTQWRELTILIKNDLLEYERKIGKLPVRYQLFDFSKFNYGDKVTDELPSRIVEYLIENGTFDDKIFSSQTIQKINQLFGRFCIDVANFKSKLIEIQKHSDSPGKMKLYQMMQNGEVEEFTQFITAQDQRRFNLFPMHSTSLKISKRFEDHKFPLDSKNKYGITVLEKAFKENDFERMLYIFEKMRQSSHELSYQLRTKINLQNEQRQTVLMYAVIHEYNTELIDWLVKETQADVELMDTQGMTAWDYANSLEDIDPRIPSIVETQAQKEESILRQNRELLSAYDILLEDSSSDSSDSSSSSP